MEYRLISENDSDRILEYFNSNREHFREWEPRRGEEYYEIDFWEKFIETNLIEQNEGRFAFFVAYEESNNSIVAHCTLSQIFYGAFRACYMGFGVSTTHQGKGVAFELCSAAISHAFEKLSLNRIMANYMPHNNRSANLINRLGFRREGMAENYLKINGQWQNHVLTSLTNPKST